MSGGGGSVPYWQERLTKVVERDRFLLKEGKYTDVVFLVGEEAREFNCHRLYLAKTSSAFESMLFGALASPLGEPIHIPDATPDGFQALLTYIYEGRVELKTFSAASGLLQLSKKYLLPQELQQQCRAQCWTLIYPEAVWQAIQFASENQEDVILDTAWKMVLKIPRGCFHSRDFCKIPEDLLLQLVQQEIMNCTEFELYKACVRWGQAEIIRRGLPESEQGLRTALDNILPHIRFLTMDNKELATSLTTPKCVTNDEALNLFILKNSLDESSKLTASTELTRFDISCESRGTYEKIKTFQVEGCQSDLLYCKKQTSTFNLFTVFYLPIKHSPHLYHVVGIVLPCQVKEDAAEGETYEEDVTVHVYKLSNDNESYKSLLFKEKFRAVVPYNEVFVVPFNTLPCCHEYAVYTIGIKVILHRSGLYPYDDQKGDKWETDAKVAVAVNNAFPGKKGLKGGSFGAFIFQMI